MVNNSFQQYQKTIGNKEYDPSLQEEEAKFKCCLRVSDKLKVVNR